MVTEKLNEYLTSKGISMYAFENSLGVSRGSISKAIKENKSIGSQVVENILITYSDINPDWLLTGHGSMLRNDKEQPAPQLAAPAIPLGEESIIYKMYQDQLKAAQGEKEGKEALIEEIGGLKERIRTLESKLQEYEPQPEALKGAINTSDHAKDATIKRPSLPNADNATSAIAP